MEAVSGDLAILQVHDFQNHTSNILFGYGISPRFQGSYNDHFGKLNLWRRQGHRLYAPGRVNLSEELCPTSFLESSEFYNDFLRPLDGVSCIGAVIAVQGTRAPTLTSTRGSRKPKFSEQERRVAQFLVPHLQRAWTVCERLQLLSGGESVMDALSLGIVFLSDNGTVIYCNRAGENILCSGDGLSLENGALCANRSHSKSELRHAIRQSVSPTAVVSQESVLVARPSMRRPYQVVASPLRNRFRQFLATPAPVAVVFITDPDQQQPTNTQRLVQLYKLTPREAEMAARLSSGKTVEQVAEEMSITYETARTNLRRIFSKTETSRQGELLLLIAKLTVGY